MKILSLKSVCDFKIIITASGQRCAGPSPARAAPLLRNALACGSLPRWQFAVLAQRPAAPLVLRAPWARSRTHGIDDRADVVADGDGVDMAGHRQTTTPALIMAMAVDNRDP
jgi:hypothetical protein